MIGRIVPIHPHPDTLSCFESFMQPSTSGSITIRLSPPSLPLRHSETMNPLLGPPISHSSRKSRVQRRVEYHSFPLFSTQRAKQGQRTTAISLFAAIQRTTGKPGTTLQRRNSTELHSTLTTGTEDTVLSWSIERETGIRRAAYGKLTISTIHGIWRNPGPQAITHRRANSYQAVNTHSTVC